MVTHQDSDHIGGIVAMLQDAGRPVVSRLLFNSPYVRYNVAPPPYAEPSAEELARSDDDYSLSGEPSSPIVQSLREASNLTYLAQHANPVIPIQLTGPNTMIPMDYQPVLVVGPSDANLQTYYADARPILNNPSDTTIPGGVVNRASIIHQVISQIDHVSLLFTGDAWDNQTAQDGGPHVDIRTAIGIYGPVLPVGTERYRFLKVPHHGSQLSEDHNFYSHVFADNYLISGATHGNPTLTALQWIVDANTTANRQFRIYATNNVNGISQIITDPNRRPSVNRHYHLYALAAASNAITFTIENGVVTYPTAAQVIELDPWTAAGAPELAVAV